MRVKNLVSKLDRGQKFNITEYIKPNKYKVLCNVGITTTLVPKKILELYNIRN